MNSLSTELEHYLLDKGAALCGFAELNGIVPGPLSRGVSVAVAIPPHIVASIAHGPSRIYFDAYHSLNDRLDGLVTAAADFLCLRGYQAHAQTRASVTEHEGHRTDLPHKTVATRAGLGWIGKCALLVTPGYGPAVRLSSLLTDAPLSVETPIESSRCGGCTACIDRCPGKAVSGKLWKAGMDRDEFFNAKACYDAARALSAACLKEEITLCGKCIEVCPYTRRYLECSGLWQEQTDPMR